MQIIAHRLDLRAVVEKVSGTLSFDVPGLPIGWSMKIEGFCIKFPSKKNSFV